MKTYTNVGVAIKAPPCFHLAQNGHFHEHGWSNFYETFESGFFDLKQIHNSTKINKLSFKIFGPPQTPLAEFSF